MNRKLAITITLLTLLTLSSATQVLAQIRNPGIKPLDTFTYAITANWTSDNATQEIPIWITDFNQTKQYKILVGIIDGANVTTTVTWDFKNGTQLPFLVTTDIDLGLPYYISGEAPPFEAIAAANLTAGNVLYLAGTDLVTINQTITRNYASGPRDTNVVERSAPLQNSTTNPTTNETIYTTTGNQDVTYYLDKQTGMLIEQKVVLESSNPKETAIVTLTLKQTNVWDASTQQSTSLTVIIAAAVVVAVVIVVIIGVIISRKKGKSRKKTRRY
jgi:hypothetical protein